MPNIIPALSLTQFLLLMALLGYLLGSLSFAILVSRLRGLADPRSYGSKNPGATNMLRSGDKRAAALTLLGDALKGLVAVLLASQASQAAQLDAQSSQWVLASVALAAFLGHLFPIYFGFRGGKGVATALGILLGLSGWLGLACLAVWLGVFALTRISSLSALTAAASAPIWWLLGLDGGASGGGAPDFLNPVFWALLSMTALLIARHHQNIRSLLARTEEKS